MQLSALTLQHCLALVHGLHLVLVVSWLVLIQAMHCLTLLKKLVVVQMQLLSATPTLRLHQQTLVTLMVSDTSMRVLRDLATSVIVVHSFGTQEVCTTSNLALQTSPRQQQLRLLVQVAQMLITSRTLLSICGKERHEKP
jgi:hypothetical protein